jgi:hypothetical protein
MDADIPSEVVLSIHFAEMVVHRWNPTTAIGSQCQVPDDLLDAASEVAGDRPADLACDRT